MMRQRHIVIARRSARFAVGFGVVGGMRAFGKGASPLYVLASAAFSFVIFFVLAFLLIASGVATPSNTKGTEDPSISPWFGWLIAGGVAAFFLGLLPLAAFFPQVDAVRLGRYSAAVWVVGVGCAWGVVRSRQAPPKAAD